MGLVIGVVSSSISHIVQDVIARKSESLGDCQKSLGAERSFRVDVEALSLSTAHVYRGLKMEVIFLPIDGAEVFMQTFQNKKGRFNKIFALKLILADGMCHLRTF